MGMKLKLAERAQTPGYEERFRFETAAEAFGFAMKNAALEGVVRVEGTLLSTGRAFRVTGEAAVVRSFVCDRCLGRARAEERYAFTEDFFRDGGGSDGSAFEGDAIDLTPLVRDTILAAQPIQNLCRLDCRGLCPRCGKDLNEGVCGCGREAVDLRLEALRDWTGSKDL